MALTLPSPRVALTLPRQVGSCRSGVADILAETFFFGFWDYWQHFILPLYFVLVSIFSILFCLFSTFSCLDSFQTLPQSFEHGFEPYGFIKWPRTQTFVQLPENQLIS